MLARRPKSSQAMAMRARIVLHVSRGIEQLGGVANKLHITGATVGKVAGTVSGVRTGRVCWMSRESGRRARSRRAD